MTILLYLMTCLMSPSPLINLAESRVKEEGENMRPHDLYAAGAPAQNMQ